METEQRRDMRYSPKKSTIVAFGKDNIKVGKIENISISGLAFHVTSDKGSLVEVISTIDLFSLENGFRMTEVPCTIVYCKAVVKDYGDVSDSYPLRSSLYGLKFESLTKKHEEKLIYFIENNSLEIDQMKMV